MFSLRKTIWAAGFAMFSLALLIGIVAAVTRPKAGPETKVTAQTILDRIADRYVVVTKTAYVNQQSEIKIDQGSRWSNLLWGQTVKARGIIKIDIGVDLSNLTEEDIAVDNRARQVFIDIPNADIIGGAQYGDIEVESKQGVLKYIFDNDPNEDHNRALEQMIGDAKTAVRGDKALFASARQDSIGILRLVVESLGYELTLNDPPTES
jgi:hypothetical protein